MYTVFFSQLPEIVRHGKESKINGWFTHIKKDFLAAGHSLGTAFHLEDFSSTEYSELFRVSKF